MSLFDWDERFATGDALIDLEHQRLFAFAGSLDRATRDEGAARIVGPFLAELLDYTETHFAHEEALMREFAYPDLAAHQEIHADLRARIRGFEFALARGEAVLSTEILIFVKRWLLYHIGEDDMRVADHVREQRAAAGIERV